MKGVEGSGRMAASQKPWPLINDGAGTSSPVMTAASECGEKVQGIKQGPERRKVSNVRVTLGVEWTSVLATQEETKTEVVKVS